MTTSKAIIKKMLQLEYVVAISQSEIQKKNDGIVQSFRIIDLVPGAKDVTYQGEVTLFLNDKAKIRIDPPSSFTQNVRHMQKSDLFDFADSPLSFADQVDHLKEVCAYQRFDTHQEAYRLIKEYYEWYKEHDN